MFTGITPQICETAWSIVEPAIARAAELGVDEPPRREPRGA